jgi:hypothetical protein
MYERLQSSQRPLLEIHLDQLHSHLKQWEVQLEFQMPLSASETNRAVLSFSIHQQSASLEWLLQRYNIWKLQEGAIWTVRERFGWSCSIQTTLYSLF